MQTETVDNRLRPTTEGQITNLNDWLSDIKLLAHKMDAYLKDNIVSPPMYSCMSVVRPNVNTVQQLLESGMRRLQEITEVEDKETPQQRDDWQLPSDYQ